MPASASFWTSEPEKLSLWLWREERVRHTNQSIGISALLIHKPKLQNLLTYFSQQTGGWGWTCSATQAGEAQVSCCQRSPGPKPSGKAGFLPRLWTSFMTTERKKKKWKKEGAEKDWSYPRLSQPRTHPVHQYQVCGVCGTYSSRSRPVHWPSNLCSCSAGAWNYIFKKLLKLFQKAGTRWSHMHTCPHNTSTYTNMESVNTLLVMHCGHGQDSFYLASPWPVPGKLQKKESKPEVAFLAQNLLFPTAGRSGSHNSHLHQLETWNTLQKESWPILLKQALSSLVTPSSYKHIGNPLQIQSCFTATPWHEHLLM